MSKYNYDKSILSGLGVGPFLGEVKLREQKIAEADSTPSISDYNSNILGKKLHPSYQNAIVEKIIDHGSGKQYFLAPNKDKGMDELAYFRAGQYISFLFDIDGMVTCRPYTICSGPKDALGNKSSYSILVKGVEGGICSNYILNNWKVGTEVFMSGPLGHYYYTSLRDAEHVVALAGGSGITPFYSMACAIDQGTEDFKLTILYGSRFSNDILLKDELEELEKRNPDKIKVVHIISDEEKEGFEHGFITAEIIQKYSGDGDYSVFMCGPQAMMTNVMTEINKIGLPLRRVRLEVPGETLDVSKVSAFKDIKDGVKHSLKVYVRGEMTETEIDEKTSLMRAIENAGLHIPSDCRSGKCGFCRSRLISGEIYMLNDNRRAADSKFGWIHPCQTFARSDIELEIFPKF